MSDGRDYAQEKMLRKRVAEAQKRIMEQADLGKDKEIPFPDHKELTPKEAEQFRTKPAVDYRKLRENPQGGCDF
jgi:hypothetical protein